MSNEMAGAGDADGAMPQCGSDDLYMSLDTASNSSNTASHDMDNHTLQSRLISSRLLCLHEYESNRLSRSSHASSW